MKFSPSTLFPQILPLHHFPRPQNDPRYVWLIAPSDRLEVTVFIVLGEGRGEGAVISLALRPIYVTFG